MLLLQFFSEGWLKFLRLVLFGISLVVGVVIVDGLSLFIIPMGCGNILLLDWRNIVLGCCIVLLFVFRIPISTLLLGFSDASL